MQYRSWANSCAGRDWGNGEYERAEEMRHLSHQPTFSTRSREAGQASEADLPSMPCEAPAFRFGLLRASGSGAEGNMSENLEKRPITEEWLRSVGFKWHQFDRQPDKQWLLWLGDITSPGDTEDLGIELAPGREDWWFCWLRSDCSSRYSRFLHVRHIRTTGELIMLVQGITGTVWDPANHIGGAALRPERAEAIRKEYDRLDKRIMREGHPWRDIEKDDTRGGALPEHMQHAIDAKLSN